MILTAILLAALQAEALPEADIVVIGARLAGLDVMVGKDAQGRFTCGLTQSSGNVRLDNRLCKASAACVRQHGDDGGAVKACIADRKPKLLAQLRAELSRKSAR